MRHLDGYRGLAAMGVVVFHVAGRSKWAEDPGRFGLDGGALIARLGNYGVCVFFLLSGLVLYRPYVAAHLSGGAQPRLSRYLTRRVLRIFPAYLVALTAFYALGLVAALGGLTDGEYLAQYLLLQNYVDRGFATSLPVAWTLCIEMAFYLSLPLIAAGFRRLPGGRSEHPVDRLVAQLTGLLVLVAVAWSYRVYLFAERPAWPGSPPNWLPAYLDWFALGMLLAVMLSWRRAGGEVPRWLSALADHPWLCWSFALELYWVTVQLHIPPDFMDDSTRTLLRFLLNAVSAFLVLLPGVLGRSRSRAIAWLDRPTLVFLGSISYGIYLWHLILIRWMDDAGYELSFASRLVATVTLTVVVATVSHRLIELPAMSLSRRRSRPGAAVAVAPSLIPQ
ncbi:MAG: acyltransferase family protein [Acidimicrobiales bacterium]